MTNAQPTDTQLDARAKKAIIKIADTLEDISQKLDHIIKKQTEDFFSLHSTPTSGTIDSKLRGQNRWAK